MGNSISNSSTYSVGSYTNKGMSGLVSGLDTEGMVEQMLSGTQNKIDKQNATKQQLVWKQEIYRELITDINSFQNKFFNVDSSTNFLSTSFFDSMTATSTSSAFSVTGTSNASVGNVKVAVTQLAQNARITTNDKVSRGMTIDYNADAFKKEVVLDVAGQEVKVNLDGADTTEKMVEAINNAFTSAGVSATATAGENDKLTIDGNVYVSKKSSALGLKSLGLTSGKSAAKDADGNYSLSSTMTTEPEFSFQVALDGVNATINLDASKLGTKAEFMNELQLKLNRAYGTGAITLAENTDGGIDLQTGAGRQIQVGGTAEVLDTMGLVSNQSNKISQSTALSNTLFATELQGDTFKFKINDQEFEFDSNATVYQVMKKINNSGAGVRVTYSAFTDKFSIESTSSGSGFDIRMEQTEGNLLTAMFGVNAGEAVTSKVLANGPVEGGSVADWKDFKEGSFTLNVNGSDFTVKFGKKKDDETYNREEALNLINRQLEAKYGIADNGEQKVKLGFDADGKFKVQANDGVTVSFAKATGKEDEKNLANMMGFVKEEENTNRAVASKTLAELGLSGLTDNSGNAIAAETTLEQLESVSGGKFKFDNVTARLTLALNNGDGAGSAELNKKLFGTETITLGDGQINSGLIQKTEGQDAKVTVEKDGEVIETIRSSNSFTLDGLNFELKEVSKKDDAGNYVMDSVSTTRDTNTIFEGIKSFVEEYNKLIEKLNGYTDEKATYRSYAPLTSKQKEEMSEREVELWEEKAKEGLLRNDSDISSFVSAMRIALYQKPADAKYALFDLGIETGSYSSKGKLVLNETKLKQMLQSDPEAIRQLFTDETDGLAKKLSDAIDATAKLSSGSPGSLVRKAGMAGYASDKNNEIYNQITNINSRIKDLNAKYEKERARYWNQFNAMEQVIANMNSQSSWITQQFSM